MTHITHLSQVLAFTTGFCWLIRSPISMNMRWSPIDFAQQLTPLGVSAPKIRLNIFLYLTY
jgi:hypothetical protein